MRFLMVTSFYPPHHFGGDATYVRQLSRALVNRGHEARVVYCHDAYRASGGHVEQTAARAEDGVSVRMLASRYARLSPLVSQQTGRPGLKRAAMAEELGAAWDVVHFHNISLMGGPKILSMSKAPLTLLTAHDHWLVCASHIFWKNGSKPCDGRTCISCQIRSKRPPQLWRQSRLLARSLAGVDRIFAPSSFTRDALATQGINRPITVQPLFAPAAFDTLSRRDPISRPAFLFAGRVTGSKGIDRLVALFRQRPGYDLHIVGDGDLQAPMRQAFRDHTNVIFHARIEQDDLKTYYRNVTATILPSLAPETFGLTTIEGFSQATPAIVRDAGGAGEVVREAKAGIVFQTDAEALTAIDRLATDPALRDRMGKAARQAYLSRFREDTHVDAYLDTIRHEMRAAPAP